MGTYEQIKAAEFRQQAKDNKAAKAKTAKVREAEAQKWNGNLNTSEFPIKGELRGDIVYASLIELFCQQLISQYALSEIATKIAVASGRNDKVFLKTAARVASSLATIESDGFMSIITKAAVTEQVKVESDDERVAYKIVTNIIEPEESLTVDRSTFFAWARKELTKGAKLC